MSQGHEHPETADEGGLCPSVGPTSQEPGSLWRDRSFVLYLAARTVGVAGYAVTAVALPVLVLQLTGSALLTSLVVAVEVLPYLVFGLLAGAVADRVDRRRVMLASQGVAAACLLSVPVAQAVGVLHVGHVLAVATALATCWVWFDAASFGVLPALVGRARLVRANSLLYTSATLTDVVVPAGAGVLVVTVGAAYALGVDAAAYVLAAAMIAAVSGRFSTGADEAVKSSPGGPRLRLGADIGEGLRFLWGHDVIRPLVLVGAGSSVSAGAVAGLLVVLGTRQLGLDVDDERLGLIWTAVAVGALLGAPLLPRLTGRLPLGWVSIGSLSLTPVLMVALALSGSLWVGLALLGAFQAAVTVTILNGISARQVLTPDHLQGRVNTTARMIAWGGTPVGALLAGLLAEATTVRTALLVSSVAVVVAAIGSWSSSLRSASSTRGLVGG